MCTTITGVDVLPAYAGMIRSGRASVEPEASAPRVCGDDPRGDHDYVGQV